ncbi:MAG: hypothetical protein EBS89_11395, partial [Proteobacteria bacterium]|nr:hypothetical protein [Pseudomonadota bacterium]
MSGRRRRAPWRGRLRRGPRTFGGIRGSQVRWCLRTPKYWVEFFGGDLDGVTEKLDYIEDLGVNGIYFTPFFPAQSNHRYDASSFDEVDPLLGGNDAWFKLVKAANKKKVRLVGDITSNHCGAGHHWLAKAKKDKKSKEAGYFYWTKKYKWGYEGWWGLQSLPKLNYGSKDLRKAMYEAPNS